MTVSGNDRSRISRRARVDLHDHARQRCSHLRRRDNDSAFACIVSAMSATSSRTVCDPILGAVSGAFWRSMGSPMWTMGRFAVMEPELS
jgi:hypothetical protein